MFFYSKKTHTTVAGFAKVLPVLTSVLFSSGIEAQQQYSGVLEEITVTARKREESLQATPIAVSAFSANDLEKRNLDNLMQLGAYAPNVTMSNTSRGSGGTTAHVYIRGVGQDDYIFTTDPGVGIYIDGVYHPRTVGGVMDLLDLERIEVLRGPQGALFGKNTIGGALNVVSAAPGEEFGGSLQVTFGRFDRIDARGSADLPANERFFTKFAFSTKNRDGYGDVLDFNTGQVIEEGLGDEEQVAFRGAARWLISDKLTADFSVDYSHFDQNSTATILTGIDQTAATAIGLWNGLVGGPAGTPYNARFIIPNNVNDSYGNGPNGQDFDGWGFNGTIEWDLGWATLKSITGYREFDTFFGRDGDGSPLAIIHTTNAVEQDQLSQEFQLFGTSFDDRLKWQTGFFYFDESGTDVNTVRLAEGLFNALEAIPVQLAGLPCAPPFVSPGCPGNPINAALDLNFDILNKIDITSLAIFSQATYDLTDRLSLTAGMRYTYEEKEYSIGQFRPVSGTFAIPADTITRDSWNELTPMGSVQFQWTDDVMIYASVSEGFKSGGFNGRPVSAVAIESFDPEFVTSYEIGIKSEWLDRRLRLNAALFHMDYKDMQINVVSFSPATGTLILRTDNVANAELRGVELELQALPMQGVELGATLGYLDFQIEELAPSITDINLGTENPFTPEWTASAYLQYNWPWQNYGEFSLRGDWTFEDESFSDILNVPEIARKAHSMYNVRLSFNMQKYGLELTAFGTNLSDKRVIQGGVSSFTSFGHAEAVYNRPREWGVTIKKTF